MEVLKRFGKVYGAKLSANERKALDIEIKKESREIMAEITRKHEIEVDAIFLWWLHKKLGFGPKRLKEFYDDFAVAMEELAERYGMKEGEELWYCTHLLKEYGVDLEKWNEEKGETK